MPGSGVQPDNITDIARKTGAVEFHSSARINTESNMSFTVSSMNENLQTVSVNPEAITGMVKRLSELK